MTHVNWIWQIITYIFIEENKVSYNNSASHIIKLHLPLFHVYQSTESPLGINIGADQDMTGVTIATQIPVFRFRILI
jgi:hypothetical protein